VLGISLGIVLGNALEKDDGALLGWLLGVLLG